MTSSAEIIRTTHLLQFGGVYFAVLQIFISYFNKH